MLSLAWPVVVAEMGWTAMGIVDTIMVGPLGPAAIGAVGTGTILFLVVMMPGFGILLALDTFVAQSFGAGRVDECHRWLRTGLCLGLIVAVPSIGLLAAASRDVGWLHLHPAIARITGPYLGTLSWGLLPLLLYAAFRRYLQGMGVVRPITFALVSANLVNMAALAAYNVSG